MKKIVEIIFIFIVFSCNAQNSNYNPKAVELNNQAINLISKAFGDESILKQALEILNNSIKLDNAYYVAYQNKATVLCKLGQYDSAIKTLDMVVKLHKSTAEALSTQGFIFEMIGNNIEATAKYQAAFTEYERLIKEDPNKIEYQVNKAFLLVFLVDKDSALKSIEEISMKYPDNKNTKEILSLLNNFDREQFIESYR